MDPVTVSETVAATGMESITTALNTALSSTSSDMLSAIGTVLPTALTVAGAILVVTLGWRLFRNFTRG